MSYKFIEDIMVKYFQKSVLNTTGTPGNIKNIVKYGNFEFLCGHVDNIKFSQIQYFGSKELKLSYSGSIE